MDLKKKVKEAFLNATDEISNGETATNVQLYHLKGETRVTFDIDRGRGGIDSYYESSVTFKEGKVECKLGESLEGCGIEELVEENLKEVAKLVTSPLKSVLKEDEKLTLYFSTATFIHFVTENSNMDWNQVCDFVNKDYLSGSETYVKERKFPNPSLVKEHGYDYFYEFFKAHPHLGGYNIMFVFDD